jgi:hypothetical protein
MIEIDKEVPLPAASAPKRAPKYPFVQMEVGDSFVVQSHQLGSVRALCQRRAIQLGRAYLVRPHLNAWRCWRTK